MTELEITQAIREALAPGRFIALPPCQLSWAEVPEEVLYWEMFQGRLLGQSMTRERRRFHAWNIHIDVDGMPSEEPIIAIKRDLEDGTLHVTRGLEVHGHRATSVGNVIETSEATVWSRELVGSLDPNEHSPDQLRNELTYLVFSAVVGTGRLPLTSLEAPLPAFSLGQVGYLVSSHGTEPITNDASLPNMTPSDAKADSVKLLELMLRSTLDPAAIATTKDFLRLLQRVFLNVSLSPYTDFVSRVLAALRIAQDGGTISVSDRIQFLSWLLRLQWRHLNAYDLFLFHHRGANYPDALLVAEVLTELFACSTAHPELFTKPEAKMVRRGLTLGWLLRTIYTGHKVPSQPTSPGENLRVMPAPWQRVTEDEIFNPYGRSRQLFAEPLPISDDLAALLRSTLGELAADGELGAALFLDRPLGIAKAVGEPDATPMLSYIARSRKLALRNLELLERHGGLLIDAALIRELRHQAEHAHLPGVALQPIGRSPRPGVVSIEDALQSSDDFIIERTTGRSMAALRWSFESPTAINDSETWYLLLPVRDQHGEVLRVFDEQWQPWMDLKLDATAGYFTRMGVELPQNGMIATIDGKDHAFSSKKPAPVATADDRE